MKKHISIFAVTLLLPLLGIRGGAFAQVLYNNGGTISNLSTIIYANGGIENQSNGLFENSGDIYLTGDWTNSAGNTALSSSSTGTVLMVGNAQNIQGSSVTEFYDLSLLNNNVKKLNGINAIVKDSLKLNDCEFATDNNSAFVTNTNSGAISRTTGFVSSLGTGAIVRSTASTSSYFFPVGSSLGTTRFRPVEIAPNNNAATTFGVRLANVDATTENFDRTIKQTSISKINDLYYHRVYGSTPADITVYYDATLDGMVEGLAHWQNQPQWEDMVASIAPGNYGLSAMRKQGWNDYIYPAIALMTISPECEVFVPNAFSPNNDGQNDFLCIYGKCIETLNLVIYDRWGEKVFETTDAKQCWDGTYKGKLMNSAVFVYYYNVTLFSGENLVKKGNISLVR